METFMGRKSKGKLGGIRTRDEKSKRKKAGGGMGRLSSSKGNKWRKAINGKRNMRKVNIQE